MDDLAIPVDENHPNQYTLLMARSSSSRLKLPTGAAVNRAWPIIYERLAFFAAHLFCFGVVRGAYLFLLSRAWPKSRGREVGLRAPGTGAPLTVRLGTSDVQVFNDIYLRQEFGWKLSSSPKVIIDAGAYTGLSTSFFATQCPNAMIIAIEPDEDNFRLLVRNTARYANVHTVRAALWAESGSVSLVDPGSGAWGLRLLESNGSDTVTTEAIPALRSRSIQAVTITDIMRDFHLDKIDLLKIDVEGSEKEIFASADPWIDSVDAICVELHDRFKVGCSRSFFKAVEDFPIELRRGEDVLVMRDQSSQN